MRTTPLFAAFGLLCLAGPGFAQVVAAPGSMPLRAGDRVQIWVMADSSQHEEIPVEERGQLTLPRLGRFDASGIPAEALSDSIRGRYRDLYRRDVVIVVPLRRVSVGGEVRKPNVYFVPLVTSLRDVIALAGGISEIGNPCCVSVVRGNAREVVRDWESLASGNVLLQSGDALMVPREAWFKRNALSVVSGMAILLSAIVTRSR